MDQRVSERLATWEKQIEILRFSESQCLKLEAHEKPLWGKLFLQAEGKTVAEKESWVYTRFEWKEFQEGLAGARNELNNDKRLLDLRIAEYQAEYLASKYDSEAILRTPRVLT